MQKLVGEKHNIQVKLDESTKELSLLNGNCNDNNDINHKFIIIQSEAVCREFSQVVFRGILKRVKLDLNWIEACLVLDPREDVVLMNKTLYVEYINRLIDKFKYNINIKKHPEVCEASIKESSRYFFENSGKEFEPLNSKTNLNRVLDFYGNIIKRSEEVDCEWIYKKIYIYCLFACLILSIIPTSVIIEQLYSKVSNTKGKNRHSISLKSILAILKSSRFNYEDISTENNSIINFLSNNGS